MNKIFDTYIPEGFNTISPYLLADNAEELIQFLKDAFYAEELNRSINPNNGDIANVILKIGYSKFMVSQGRGQYSNMRTAFYLYVNDVDALHKRAKEHGAKEEFPPAEMPYGDRQSGVVDPAGNYWWISERKVKTSYED